MALKTFNIEESVYRKFSDLCKGKGMSMSKQIEFFMKSVIEENPQAKKEYLQKLENIRKEPTIKIGTIDDFQNRYSLN